MAADPPSIKSALLVVDMQEDFCPPSGSLAVPEGRSITPLINLLLRLPTFALKVATRDWHPPTHVSFASNHPPPRNRPFVDLCTVTNPNNPAESYQTRLWPVHCVRDTPGASLIPELDAARIDLVLDKGTDPRVEMYSAFHDPLTDPPLCDTGLAAILRREGVTHVYVVGLAADYCVRSTALDARAAGFVAHVIEEATRAVDPEGWPRCRRELEAAGVRVVSRDGPEVQRLFEGVQRESKI